jgi:hypothetical protein
METLVRECSLSTLRANRYGGNTTIYLKRTIHVKIALAWQGYDARKGHFSACLMN